MGKAIGKSKTVFHKFYKKCQLAKLVKSLLDREESIEMAAYSCMGNAPR